MTVPVRLALVTLLGLVMVGCQILGQGQPTPVPTAAEETPEVTPEETEPAETQDGDGDGVNVLSLDIGDCLNVVDAETNTVEPVDCDDEHEYELYALIEADGDDYPTEDEWIELATECQGDLFEEYVGTDYASSRWYSSEVAPSEEEWEDGFTAVACVLYDPDEPTTTGSAHGSEAGGGDGDGDGDGAGAGVGDAADFGPGDCYNVDDAETASFETVGCEDEHEYEVYAVLEVDGDAYPGEQALLEQGLDCWGIEFEPYVGISYAESRWYSVELIPTEEEWDEGAQEIICALYDPQDRTTTGSAEGSEE